MRSRKDSAYTNGVIAVKEKKLLKDKLVRMCSMSEDEAFRLLLESGFGGEPLPDAEALALSDEREIDRFIREYAPTDEAEEYLLSPRDFHNAKAIVKARFLNTDPKPMLGGDGKFSAEELQRLVESGDTKKLGAELDGAIGGAEKLLEGEDPSGAEVGFLFEKAQFDYLLRVTKKLGVCRKLLVRRIDMTNLLTYFRAGDADEAGRFFIGGGTLTKEKLALVYGDRDALLRAFQRSDYEELVKKLCAASDDGFAAAEKLIESFETDFFAKKPYELSGQGSFLYYVFRRRAENENVRVVFVCLRAGLQEAEIKKRLRGTV